MDTTNVTLAEFWAIYAVIEHFDHIPDFHHQVFDFLEDYKNWNNGTGVLQIFRNGAKSSIVAGFIVWLLCRDPTLIILVQSADDATAKKMVSDVRKIITHHPLASHLRGKEKVWAERGISVRGTKSGRELSVSARGIMSNVTGSRADIIIYDDAEGKKNAETKEMRNKVRSRVAESHHLLNPGGRKLFIGTPHSYESIYPELLEAGASSLTIPMLTNVKGDFPFITGDCIWPERWSAKDIAEKQLTPGSTKAEFYSQYLLQPYNIEDSILDPTRIKVYSAEVEQYSANNATVLKIGDKILHKGEVFWDVALSKATRDSSVVALVYAGIDGSIYVHRILEVKGDADQQAKKVKDFLVAHSCASIRIETNGIGAMMPEILKKYVRGMDIAVIGEHTKVGKTESILTAFEVPLSAGFLHAHESVMQTLFPSQLRDFSPSRVTKHDDFIDAPAKAIHKLPVRYGRDRTNSKGDFSPWRPLGTVIDIEREYFSFDS
ncbi:MAG: phage terminase large subunit [Burkholderiales bacterium]